MSKRDDDSQADIEVGMTTAERRRRRRRGGGLRVPSDNVPRRANPPVVAPVPEDPSLAMSIAYSFTNDASEPIPRVAMDAPSGKVVEVQPDAFNSLMSTVIEPASSPGEQSDFETKTREMSAVDLEALGIDEPSSSITATDPGLPGMSGSLEARFKDRNYDEVEDEDEDDVVVDKVDGTVGAKSRMTTDRADVEVDVDMGGLDGISTLDVPIDTTEPTVSVAAEPAARPVRVRKERLQTVALTDEDLEEVREAVRAASIAPAPVHASLPVIEKPATTQAPPPKPPTPSAVPVPTKQADSVSNKTMPLTVLDFEGDKNVEEPLSVPEIDIQELSERAADGSGEIEVSIDEDASKPNPLEVKAPPPGQPPASTDAKRVRPASVPPSSAQPVASSPAIQPPHPPPPPPAHKTPPTPPPAPTVKKDAKDKPGPVVGRASTQDGKLNARGKPWFADLFDEDYLRTLPFLTPQATQAEAEFVIDAMGLTAGAQVLDVGCGYGRHAMELAARGFHVVGLDLSTPLLVRGGEEAHRRGLQINFIRGDMRELDFEGQFDGAYCLFSTFGYFDDEMNKKAVANIARALKPGGRVMIEILNRDYLIADLPTRVWWEGDGCVVLEEVDLNYFSSRIQVNRSVVFDDGRQLEQEISVRAYSLHEVGKLMHAAGFRVLEVSGGYHTRGRFFGNQSRHIIVLAERKEAATTSAG